MTSKTLAAVALTLAALAPTAARCEPAETEAKATSKASRRRIDRMAGGAHHRAELGRIPHGFSASKAVR